MAVISTEQLLIWISRRLRPPIGSALLEGNPGKKDYSDSNPDLPSAENVAINIETVLLNTLGADYFTKLGDYHLSATQSLLETDSSAQWLALVDNQALSKGVHLVVTAAETAIDASRPAADSRVSTLSEQPAKKQRIIEGIEEAIRFQQQLRKDIYDIIKSQFIGDSVMLSVKQKFYNDLDLLKKAAKDGNEQFLDRNNMAANTILSSLSTIGTELSNIDGYQLDQETISFYNSLFVDKNRDPISDGAIRFIKEFLLSLDET